MKQYVLLPIDGVLGRYRISEGYSAIGIDRRHNIPLYSARYSLYSIDAQLAPLEINNGGFAQKDALCMVSTAHTLIGSLFSPFGLRVFKSPFRIGLTFPLRRIRL
jgi:hypothetical protein